MYADDTLCEITVIAICAMGKTGKERKRRRLLQEQRNAGTESGNDFGGDGAGVSAADAATATRVLDALAAQPEAFKGKEFKALRAALHALRQSEGASMVLGFGVKEVSLSQVVSDALRDARWGDAIRALDKMRQRNQQPKLGSVQRWVRECDAAGDYDSQAMLVLDSVLRTADPAQVGAMQSKEAQAALTLPGGATSAGHLKSGGRVRWYEPWDAFSRPVGSLPANKAGETMRRAQAASPEKQMAARGLFKSCFSQEAQDRKPPNLHPLTIHTSPPGAIPLDSSHAAARRIEVPFVPGAFLIADLFTPGECHAIIDAGEAVGYDPDQPAGGTSAADKKSILAHAFVWCTDKPFIEEVWRRIEGLVPCYVAGGRAVGINRRWRCYRYTPGSVYRPHIDGAWPGSGVDDNGDYGGWSSGGGCADV